MHLVQFDKSTSLQIQIKSNDKETVGNLADGVRGSWSLTRGKRASGQGRYGP